MNEKKSQEEVNRRDFLRTGVNTIAGLSIGSVAGLLLGKSSSETLVWQLDPNICIQCEKCATNCVLDFSAVK